MAIWTYPTVPLLQQDLIQNPNVYPNKRFDAALGRNINVNNVRVDLWGGPTGTYVFPVHSTTNASSLCFSANDALAGTGAQKVHIHYLDTNYIEQEESVSHERDDSC